MRRSFTLNTPWVLEFPTDAGGVLHLRPGPLRLDASFSVRERSDDGWYAVIACDLRVANEAGRVWRATATFMSNGLFYPIIDLSRAEPGRWLHNAPPAWREALKRRRLLADVAATYDDRFYRYVWLDNTGFCWQFKYFGVSFTLAALDEATVVVRIAEMSPVWNPLPVFGPDGPLPFPPQAAPLTDEELEAQGDRWEEAGEAGEYDEARPIAYVIDAGRLLFRHTAYEEADGWTEGSVSRPLVFRRTRGQAEPQRHVAFAPGARPVATPSPGGDGGFTPMGEEYGEPAEFLTDAGGRLAVQGGLNQYAVKLERHPDSDHQPEDVLRCRVRVTDAAGTVWESVSHFTTEAFFEKLIDLDDIEVPGWDVAALDGAITGLRARLDDGAWRCALLGPGLVAFRATDQRPRVDVAPEGNGFAVRITGLVGGVRVVKVEDRFFLLDPDGGLGRKAWEEDQPLPAVGYTVRFMALAFRNTTFAVDDGFFHHSPIPIPVVFTRIGTAPANSRARFVPDAG